MSAELPSPVGAELTLADLLRDLKRHGLTLSLAQESYLAEVDGDTSGVLTEYTLHRVYQAIYRRDKEITKERAMDLVNEMQNSGILFRERSDAHVNEVVNAEERPENAARRYAMQLLRLQEGLKERDYDLSMVTEDVLMEWVLNLIDSLSIKQVHPNNWYASEHLRLQIGLIERGFESAQDEAKVVDIALNRQRKPKTQINRGGSPMGYVASAMEISIPEQHNVLADAARQARIRIERNSGEII